MIQQIHFEVYIQRKWKQEFEEIMTFFFNLFQERARLEYSGVERAIGIERR